MPRRRTKRTNLCYVQLVSDSKASIVPTKPTIFRLCARKVGLQGSGINWVDNVLGVLFVKLAHSIIQTIMLRDRVGGSNQYRIKTEGSWPMDNDVSLAAYTVNQPVISDWNCLLKHFSSKSLAASRPCRG